MVLQVGTESETRFSRIAAELVAIRAELTQIIWMIGLAIVLLLAIALKLFAP
jgi:hypothetical protein